MTTAAKSAFGTTLSRNGHPVSELTRIGSPSITVETIDVTNHQSPDGYKEFIAGLMDAGEVPIEGNFISGDTNGQIGLVNDLNGKVIQDYAITFPDATTWTFKALVTAFQTGEADVNGKLSFSATLKVSGKPTLGISMAANLTDLVVTTGTLVPSFSGTVKEYVVTISSVTDSVTITPTCSAADSIEVNGNVVATGNPSSAIILGAAGSITKATVVTKETGKADNVYTLYLTRAA